ncbi:MAG: hypothetical protein QOI26_2536, partial [Pseudonocardiales bacterium]|nr:hypothetical protein [Pseudonocardiales bacterium]
MQRSGSAAGQAHEVGRSTNTRIPASTRSRYPLFTPGAAPAQPNAASVLPTTAGRVKGYDAGSSKELPGRRTAYQQTFANPDGTETTAFSDAPVNYLDSGGNWQPIKPGFAAQPGNRLTSTGGAADITLARQLSAGNDFATVTLDASHSVGWGVTGARSAVATVRGDVARYPNFAEHADLEIAASAAGLKETIVLRSAAAPLSYDFPLRLTGLTARLAADQVQLSDADGRIRAIIPAGSMQDSASGTPASSTSVRYQLLDTPAGQTLHVQLDLTWLHDPSRVYPVRVDPSVLQPTAGSALTVRAGGSTNGATTFDVGPKVAAYLAFGSVSSSLAHETIYAAQLSVVNQSAASCKARPVSVYGVTAPWSSSSSASYPGPAYSSTPLASQSFAYGYVPPVGATSTACPVRATLFNLGAAGRDLVQRWVNGANNYGLTLRSPSDTDPLAAKTFAGPSSANPPRLYITHSPYNASYSIPNPVPAPPVLLNQDGVIKVAVTNKGAEIWTPTTYYLGYRIYDSAGNPAKDNNGAAIGLVRTGTLPSNVALGAKLTLAATIKSPHVKGRFTIDFTMVKIGGPVFTDEQVPPGRLLLEVFDIPPVIKGAYPQNGYQTPTLTPQLWADGVDIDALTGSTLSYNYKVCPGADMASTSCFSSGFQASPGWVIPAGKLSWGKTYSWMGQVRDTSSTTDTPVIALLTEVPQPAITAHLAGAPYTAQNREFDPLAGNFTTAAIDAPVTTSGPDLSVTRTYNSLDPRTDGAFGAGWSTRYDMKALAESDGSGNMLVTLPDGQQVRFGKNPDGTWTGPSNRQSSFTLVNSTYLLKDVGGASYTFSLSGKLTKIQAAWGNPLTLTYAADGSLQTVRSGNSNRTLTFTWSAGHVSSVATMAVNGATPTWAYTYSADQLIKVCAPDGSCTSYGSSSNSHYRTAVLDAKPESYWRLGEDTGGDGASEIAINLGKDVAKYNGVALGAAGAIAGAGDTAVTLSGTASYVGLPTGTAKKSRDMAVELWFKTTSSG